MAALTLFEVAHFTPARSASKGIPVFPGPCWRCGLVWKRRKRRRNRNCTTSKLMLRFRKHGRNHKTLRQKTDQRNHRPAGFVLTFPAEVCQCLSAAVDTCGHSGMQIPGLLLCFAQRIPRRTRMSPPLRQRRWRIIRGCWITCTAKNWSLGMVLMTDQRRNKTPIRFVLSEAQNPCCSPRYSFGVSVDTSQGDSQLVRDILRTRAWLWEFSSDRSV